MCLSLGVDAAVFQFDGSQRRRWERWKEKKNSDHESKTWERTLNLLPLNKPRWKMPKDKSKSWWNSGITRTLLCYWKKIQSIRKTVWLYLRKLKMLKLCEHIHSTSRHYSSRNACTQAQGDMCKTVHSSGICSRKDLKTIRMSISNETDERYNHTMESYAVMKKNKAQFWMYQHRSISKYWRAKICSSKIRTEWFLLYKTKHEK